MRVRTWDLFAPSELERLEWDLEADSVIRPPKKVALAEDDETLRTFLVEVLEEEGYEVEDFADGEELHDYLMECLLDPSLGSPDLVVTDDAMPQRRGLDVLAEFRLADPMTPFVVMSGGRTDRLASDAAWLGARLIRKPFRIEAFLEAVEEELED